MYSGNTFRFVKLYTNLEYLCKFSTYEYISVCDDCLVKMPITVFSDLIGSLLRIKFSFFMNVSFDLKGSQHFLFLFCMEIQRRRFDELSLKTCTTELYRKIDSKGSFNGYVET